MRPAAIRAALVAHGQPAAPAPQQRAIEALAAAVEAHLPPEWEVNGATLACPESLRVAADAALIFPLFMADGWFTQTELPRRLAAAAAENGAPVGQGGRVLTPFGLHPALPALAGAAARAAAVAAGIDPAEATLVLAAHGSGKSPRSAEVTEGFAAALRAEGAFGAVVTGYIEQAPFIADAARLTGPALCLPFFATTANHVTQDLPEALAEAGFTGPVLPPLGALPEIPALIAATLADETGAALTEPPGRCGPARRVCTPAECVCL